MKKRIALFLTLVLLLSLVACAGTNTQGNGESAQKDSAHTGDAVAQDTITLGLTGNLTGYDPASGEAIQKTAELAQDKINADGGILGKKVTIKVFDDLGSAEGAVNAVSRMLEDPNIVIMGGLVYSTCTLAVNEVVANGGKPTLVSGSTPSISDLENPWMFRLRTDDNVQTYCAMDFLCSQAKPSAVGSIYTTDDYSYGGNLACKRYCEENGIKFVSEGGAVGDSDFTSQILKLKDAGCEAVYLNLNAAEMVIVCRQMHELGYTPMVMAGMCASNSDFIDLVEGTEVGGWYTYSEICFDSDVPGCQEFLDEYESRYGTHNPESSAIIVYGQIQLMVDAITRAGSTDPEKIKTALEQTKDTQVITGLLTCEEDHDLPGCTFVKEITAEKVEQVRALYVGNSRQY